MTIRNATTILSLVCFTALGACSKGGGQAADQGPFPGHDFAWYSAAANATPSNAEFQWCNAQKEAMGADMDKINAFDARHNACALFDAHPMFLPGENVQVPGLF